MTWQQHLRPLIAVQDLINEIVTLANSGALLLQGALLNRVALNKQLMKALCDSHRNYNLRQMTQEVVNR